MVPGDVTFSCQLFLASWKAPLSLNLSLNLHGIVWMMGIMIMMSLVRRMGVVR